MLEHKPHVLHFSGHGTQTDEIMLLDEHDAPKPLSKDAFVKILSKLKEDLCLGVFNACYTRRQAEAIAEFID